ncbi:MAG TPA: hypothetical protein VHV83_10220, partial [Armatimonadota bacterium]|nr:hypothetical protein [Armatimonadota bacterium]
MNVRAKTLLITVAAFGCLLLILIFSSRATFLHGFLNLEKDNVRQNIVRVTAALDREFSNLETK